MKLRPVVVYTSLFILLLWGLAATIAPNDEIQVTVVRYPAPEGEDDARMQYFIDLLRLSMEKTVDTYGPYELKPASVVMSQVQAMKSLMSGKELDVIHSMTNKGRERVLRPIRIPLDKGLLGMRLLMIRETDQEKFSEYRTKNDVKNIVMGQGADWPDTEILKFNEFKVTTSPSYSPLFNMLETGQIEAFPRAVFEIFDELEAHEDKNFTVAPNIALRYPAAMYFFVRQSNKALADRIETGLRRAISDGSFDEAFNGYMQQHLQQANLENRVVIRLSNPLLPEETPLEDSALWYN